jgi:thiazole tautomerase (transcriptional regulator TenI)
VSAVPVVHAVTSDEILLRDDFLQQAKAVMMALGTRGALHLRARSLSARRMHELAQWLAGWERDSGCLVVVNDRLDVARAAGIGAVQLTSRSVSPGDARAIDPAFRIGASVHSAEAAVTAEAAGVEWCVAGSAFPTDSHPGEPAGGIPLMRAIAGSVTVPVMAIGGVTPAAIADLLNAGIYGVAAIRGVWDSPEPGEAVRGYLSMYDTHAGDS